jgi:hypothetical protein
VFDIPVMTPKGMVWCVYAPPKRPELLNGMKDEEAQSPEEEVKPNKVVPYHVAHAQLGHCGEDATHAVAAHLDWKIARGTASPCISCAEVKVKKKTFKQEGASVPTNLKRSTDDSVNPIGTRWYLDQASVKKSPEGFMLTKPNLKMLVEGATQMKFVEFLSNKNDQVESTCEILHSFKQDGMPVKFLRCDNAGENVSLEKAIKGKAWQMTNLKLEYTARDTPQQNSIAELSIFHTVLKAKTMLRAARVPKKFRYKLFPMIVKTATQLDALSIITLNGTAATRYEHLYGKLPSYAAHLRTVGEAGAVKPQARMMRISNFHSLAWKWITFPRLIRTTITTCTQLVNWQIVASMLS